MENEIKCPYLTDELIKIDDLMVECGEHMLDICDECAEK